ncbi:GNAT family N-acetyltransferase [Paenibacillus radicis (ex Xue et al. 2023)]|uniref:GNAT family N-acetyltransferase n=1 Tax=Paenibacillus radicis (ex Xue et al. 2023) TaxID=2972489 RepID=A0ABT1YND5_9BACL|nr:GNAT family N-acetyltransferase [Paenibacillus radicis (ex Xue et al. 2023)]MCR8634689.1 GNAT family N-acetyltransferase [Paenibacillus radicis (ex Xue et al. 2023)]
MNIRCLNPADAEIYREIRLKSLKENPEAFLTTYEIQLIKPIEEFQQNLEQTELKFTLGCFSKANELAGIVTFVRESNPKITHKGTIYAMYVSPEFRGMRVGYALLTELIQRAKQFPGLEQIKLTVVSNNLAAKKLYESIGFTTYGTERNAMKTNGQYWDDDMMVITF